MWPLLNSAITLTVIPFFDMLSAVFSLLWYKLLLSCDHFYLWHWGWLTAVKWSQWWQQRVTEGICLNRCSCTMNKLAAHRSTGSKEGRATLIVTYLFQLKNPFLCLRIRNNLKHALVITLHNAVGGLGVLPSVSIICFYLAAHFPNGQVFGDNKLV